LEKNVFDALAHIRANSYPGLYVTLYERVAELARLWGRLTERTSFYMTLHYLRAMEIPGQTFYVVVQDGTGAILAAAPAYFCREAASAGYYDPFARFDDIDPDYPSGPPDQFPILLVGGRSGYTTQLLLRQDLDVQRRKEIVGCLFKWIGQLAARHHARAIALMYLDRPSVDLLAEVLPLDITLLLAYPETRLDLRWADYDEYLRARGSHHRGSRSRDVKKFASFGYEVRVSRIGECFREAGPLLANTQQKYGIPTDPASMTGYLEAQAATCDPYSVVFQARKAGRLVGFVLFFAWRSDLYARVAGFDYSATASSAAYFNLMFHLPIAYAYEHQSNAVWYGPSAYEGKLMRGARSQPRFSIVIPETSSDEWLTTLSRANSVRHAALQREIRRFGQFDEVTATLGASPVSGSLRLD
jgi:predicted N-acyltransferase